MKKSLQTFSIIFFSTFLANEIAAFDDSTPLEHFACRSNYAGFSISPDGKHMLIQNTMKDNVCDIEQDNSKYAEEETYDYGLLLMNLETKETSVISSGKDGGRISDAGWLNNERIWYEPKYMMGQKKIATFAMNIDGSKKRTLYEYNGLTDNFIYSMAHDDPEHIYIANNERRPYVYDYFKINIYTGKKETIAFGPSIGDMKGVATLGRLTGPDRYPLGILLDHGLERVLYEYNKDTKEWIEHFSFNCQEPGFVPIGMYKGKMVVSGSKFSPSGELLEENDTNAIYLYDYKTKTFGEKLYQDPDYDVGGLTGSCRQASGGRSTDRLSGEISSISYSSLQPERLFFDKEDERTYLTIKSVFPDHNISISSSSSDRKKMVVRIWGTHEPGEYFYVDLNKGEVTSLFKTRPWLDRTKLSKAIPVKYKARDGLEIPALLTLTKVKTDKNYFLIMPHGGPNTKQYIGYDAWVQFFTSRGVNILQPDFRGSTGLGTEHYTLGNKQWGLTMQDDITDGVLWAIENGYADEDRVCIGGASYGGYATMAGLVFTPDVYRCGINAIGVTDQIQILENFANKASIRQSWDEEPLLEWGDISTKEGREYALSSSPVNFVKNIKAPVLVLQGSNDRTVEPRHAEDLIDKLKDLNKEYMAMFQAKSGHCVTGCQEIAALEYLQIQEEFIDKYLKD